MRLYANGDIVVTFATYSITLAGGARALLQLLLGGAAIQPNGSIGVFSAGIGNIGAFNGLGNTRAGSGQYNIGAFNGNLNSGSGDGTYNIGVFNGNLNGMETVATMMGARTGTPISDCYCEFCSGWKPGACQLLWLDEHDRAG